MERINLIQADRALLPLRTPHPLFRVRATLSPYVGCSSGCLLCPYANATKIGIKTNYLHLLERDLQSLDRQTHMALGAACEPYGDAEKQYGFAHHSIELAMKYRMPLQIVTKTDLVRRDIRLLREQSKKGLAAVSISLFTTDRQLARLYEPSAPPPHERLKLLAELRRNDIFAGIVLAPIIPCISDGERALADLFARVKKAGGEYILASSLNIATARIGERFRKIVREKFTRSVREIDALYGQCKLPHTLYARRINDLLNRLGRKYNIPLHLPTETEIPYKADISQDLLR
jgi:DNA repair photolyase